MLSKFFIDRPRFAMVISLVLIIAGVIMGVGLPVKQYPDVAPPQIAVEAQYPGADADTVARTVGVPLEEAINGVEGMIYMSSTSSNSGQYQLQITFEVGTDTDIALVKVQNRVQQATPLLPAEVTQQGVTTQSRFSNMLGMVGFYSPNGTRDELYLNDYAQSNIMNIFKRVPGMGNVQLYGAKYSVRVWLNPERMASLGLSTNEVASAISSQNNQASVGSLGSSPTPEDTMLQYTLTAKGRLESAKDFEEIVLRATPDGALVRLRDVARVELAQENYTFASLLNGQPAAILALSQTSNANALDVMKALRKTMKEIEPSLPSDTAFILGWDTTDYVNATIYEIIETLFITFSLVVLVCYIFLQDWRATLVPVVAIPVSLIATFIGLAFLGFSINILTLFGLVLVIGTVVDDAIIVVERVQYIMERDGVGPKAAAEQAMIDVSGPMTATTLVFLAIFVPVAFMGGITGVIYQQFAVTVAFSVVFSLIVALTLSPAICAHFLRPFQEKKHGPLAWFNSLIKVSTRGYVAGAMWIARKALLTLLIFGGFCAACWWFLQVTPTSFLPDEDQGAYFGVAQLPEGATQHRTREVATKMEEYYRSLEGNKLTIAILGYSFLGDFGENVASVIAPLTDWSQRTTPELQLESFLAKANAQAREIPEANINIISPPPIQGLGLAGGLDVRLESRLVNDPQRLAEVQAQFMGELMAQPEIAYAFTSYTANTPHIRLDIDRAKAEMMGVPVGSAFRALGTYFGTAYINDINIGTQVNKVIVQSDMSSRNGRDALNNVYITNLAGGQVPLSAIATPRKVLMPRSIQRYNMYPSSGITAITVPGYSTGQGMEAVLRVAANLPDGYTTEWSTMTYQEAQAGGQVAMIIVVALLFGYLFLVAQYESWTVPLGVIMSLPVAYLGALLGVTIMSISMSIYTQLGVLLLVGLAAKNAILIVEFAKEQHDDRGLSILEAASMGARERFRSVMMTALTCVIGVLPMLFANGAGAGSRLHVGTTMFFGMSISTAFGIFLIPGLYVVLQTNRERVKRFLGFAVATPAHAAPASEETTEEKEEKEEKEGTSEKGGMSDEH